MLSLYLDHSSKQTKHAYNCMTIVLIFVSHIFHSFFCIALQENVQISISIAFALVLLTYFLNFLIESR